MGVPTTISQSRRIVFTCGREPTYTRNDVLLRALRPGHQLSEITDAKPGSLTARMLRLIPRLVRALRHPHDLVVVGFYGYPLTWVARQFTQRPILFDAFLQTYGTLVEDRRRFGPNSPLAKFASAVDRIGGHSADQVLIDTQAQAEAFSQATGVPKERVHALFVSCNEDLFNRDAQPDRAPDNNIHVLYYGTYQPLHGTETVVRAARLLRSEARIRWRIIGRGQEYAHVRDLADNWALTNIEFQAPVPYCDLPGAIAAADLCLGGPFGLTEKARRVITGKTFQFLAMRKPTIVGDTPANHELLAPEQSACFVPLADADALAAAIYDLSCHPDQLQRLADAGHTQYLSCASEAVVGRQLDSIVQGMVT